MLVKNNIMLAEFITKITSYAGRMANNIVFEEEGHAYAATSFCSKNMVIHFRIAKITPQKIGYFVTFWKRLGTGTPITPFDIDDNFEALMIVAKNDTRLGYFLFPKDVLLQRNVISKQGKGGKRALRVYPSWVTVTSAQARKTQEWQLPYFHEIKEPFYLFS